jgi:Protein NO VEIN, C-terminal
MKVASQKRTPVQHATYEKLRELSRRSGKDIGDRHLESHAIDVVIALNIRNVPMTDGAIAKRILDVFGMEIPPARIKDDLADTSGTGKYSDRKNKQTWTVLDDQGRVITSKEPRYAVTQEIVSLVNKASAREERTRRMRPQSENSLASAVPASEFRHSKSPDSQIEDAAIEDAAQGGIQGLARLTKASRTISSEQLALARQRAQEVGMQGEQLIDRYFAQELKRERIDSYQWTSKERPLSSFDFHLSSAGNRCKVEVKTTKYDFHQPIHISLAELREMRQSKEPYYLYRVYRLDGNRARFRIAEDAAEFAGRILDALCVLPDGITIDCISVQPKHFAFGGEVCIELPPSIAP